LLESTLISILLNATTYASGFLQAIENACIHTERKVAFFALRIHYTSIFELERNLNRTQDKQMTESLKSLRHIGERFNREYLHFNDEKVPFNFRYYTLSDEVPFFLEAIIIDDACVFENDAVKNDSGRPTPKGIVATYHDRPKGSNDKNYTLKTFFSGEIRNGNKEKERVESYVVNYGLEVFRRSVIANAGLLWVSSHSPTMYKEPKGPEILIEQLGEGKIETKHLFCGEEISDLKKYAFRNSTEYRILIPIKESLWRSIQESSVKPDTLFETSVLEKTFHRNKVPITLNSEQIAKWTKGAKGKSERIEKISREISREISYRFSQPETSGKINKERILIFRAEGSLNIELFAKALFHHLFSFYVVEENPLPRHIPIVALFSSEWHVDEFLRIFSVVYNNSGEASELDFLRRLQIALCIDKEDDPNAGVRFLLAGHTVHSAEKSAETFLHYNFSPTHQHVKQLRYMSHIFDYRKQKNIEVDPQFPFDILYAANSTNPPKSWFMNYVERIIGVNYNAEKEGARILDVHVSSYSLLHLDGYCHPAVLLNNVGIMYRTAFFFARQLVRDKKFNLKKGENNRILIIGYTSVASELIKEIKTNLEAFCRKKDIDYKEGDIKTGLFWDDEHGTGKIVLNEDSKTSQSGENNNTTEECEYRYVLMVSPIFVHGATFFKTIRCLREREWVTEKEVNNNVTEYFCQSLVALRPKELTEESVDAKTLGHWKGWKESERTVIIQLPGVNDGDGFRSRNITVNYLADNEVRWYDAAKVRDDNDFACEKCFPKFPKGSADEVPLISIDYNSASLRTILPLTSERQDIPRTMKNFIERSESLCEGSRRKEKNDERLEAFEGCITYGHTSKAHNHFQFYFDFPKYYRKNNCLHDNGGSGNKIDDWLNDIVRKSKSIEQQAYNIIVTPLGKEESPFLASVIKNAFEYSTRLLHFSIDEAKREDVRSRFSFLENECEEILRQDSQAQIHIYFVDTTITTGYTIQRAQTLLRMLLPKAIKERNYIFDGVILLSNRSTFDSLQSYVEKPLEQVHAYVHVAVPSYNTNSNECPACLLMEQYELLRKRSSTNEMAREFGRLAKKHKVRSIEDGVYAEWQGEEFFDKHAHLRSLKEKIYHENQGKSLSDLDPRLELYSYIKEKLPNELISKGKLSVGSINELSAANDLIKDQFLKEASGVTIEDVLKKVSSNKEFFVQEMESIISDRNYARLKCTHKANLSLENQTEKNVIRWNIAELIREGFEDGEEFKKEQPEVEFENAREQWWAYLDKQISVLVSYIKVISRSPLSSNFFVRAEIMSLMLEILSWMMSQSSDTTSSENTISMPEFEELKELIDKCVAHHPSAAYFLWLSLIRRLATLHSAVFFNAEFLQKSVKFWEQLRSTYFKMGAEYVCFFELPTRNKTLFNICKCVKDSALSSSEKGRTLLLQRELLSSNTSNISPDGQIHKLTRTEIPATNFAEGEVPS